MQAVILAGGTNTRTMSLYGKCLKSMLPLFDKPIIDHLVVWASKQGITEIIIVLSFKSKAIANYLGDGSRFGIKIKYLVEDKPLGTAGSLKNAINLLNDTFIVLPSDIITDINLSEAIDKHIQTSASATILTATADDTDEFGILDSNKNGQVISFIEKPSSKESFSNRISTGIYLMDKEVLKYIPEKPYSDIALDLIPKLMYNSELYAISVDGYWCDVSNASVYKNAHFDVLESKLNIKMENDNLGKGIWMGKNVSINPSAIICPPAYFGDFVTIDADVHLAGRSIFGSNSIIGKNAYVFNTIIGHNSILENNTRITNTLLGGPYHVYENQKITSEIITSHTEYIIPMTPRPQIGLESLVPTQGSSEKEEIKIYSDAENQIYY